MELFVKTYNVGAQTTEDFSKFLLDIKDYVYFDDEDKNTLFKRMTNLWLEADKKQEYAFNKKDFQTSADIYRNMLELQKTIILIWNHENNLNPIVKNTHFCIALNQDGTSDVSHLL
tara:strand:+ start:72 stop:419 length:348 start_codon:yes stop_codon:yes gene_type:complete